MTAQPGSILWQFERDHPAYGFEHAELCVNLAAELLLVVDGNDDSATTTLTRDDAEHLRDALTAYLTEEPPR